MRLTFGLLLFSLEVTMSHETSAEQVKPSDNAAIVRGDNEFAVDLYAQLDREQSGKNLFFSPTSISVALAMTAAGARGPTSPRWPRCCISTRTWYRPTLIIINSWSNGMR